MKQRISLSEWAKRALLESKNGLVEDAKSGNYNATHFSYIKLFRPKWRKNMIKLIIAFLMTFMFSPKGIFLDLKDGHIKIFFMKLALFFIFSIPLFLFFLLFCFSLALLVIIPITILILHWLK